MKTEMVKEMYLKGDLEAIFNFEKSTSGKHLLQERFFKQSVDDRDKLMVEKLDALLNNTDDFLKSKHNNAFVAVGTAHMMGIIQGLASLGHTIRPILMSKRIYPVLDFYDRNIQTMVNTGLWFITASATIITGKAIRSERIEMGLKLIGVGIAVAVMVRSIGLINEYLKEPILPNAPVNLMDNVSTLENKFAH